MKKGEIRNLALQRRNSLDAEYRKKASIKIAELARPFIDDATVILSYHKINSEVDPKYIATHNHELLYPVITSDDKMAAAGYENSMDLPLNISDMKVREGMNIEDSRRIDLIITPLVAFDVNMNRIGYGKAYYDRFLNDVWGGEISGLSAKMPPRIGLAFKCQLAEFIPVESHDVKLSAVITEEGVIM